MKFAAITERLAGLGGAKWEIHSKARELEKQGRDIIKLTVGEPDVPTPQPLIDATIESLGRGRTGYSTGEGEPGLRAALAERYSGRCGRAISPDQVMCFPGTQTSLYAVMTGIVQSGDEVLVGDPMYATYEGVIRATGATMVPVPLRAEHGFRMQAADLESRITPKTRVIFLNTPHNPTGAILTADEVAAIAKLALKHDLWIISDEVYEDLIFDGSVFTSPLSLRDVADRVIVVSSISKSHAAPGFRSGWCIGPLAFTAALLPLAETMLFGNQPFIADMTEKAIREGSLVARGMCERFAKRAAHLDRRLSQDTPLTVHQPNAGMFALINVSSTGMTGAQYARHLLEHGGVALMPGDSFGASLRDWVRVALTVEDAAFDAACTRIIQHAHALQLETV